MYSRFFRLAALFCIIPVLANAKTMTLPNGEVLRDPTKPLGTVYEGARATSRDFKVSYILNSDQRRYAIVNGRQVGEGDQVAGARITRINKDSVQLMDNGKPRTIRLNSMQSFKKSY